MPAQSVRHVSVSAGPADRLETSAGQEHQVPGRKQAPAQSLSQAKSTADDIAGWQHKGGKGRRSCGQRPSPHPAPLAPRKYGVAHTAAGHKLRQCQTRRCMAGNICRSPTAEAMFKTVVERAGLSSEFVIDSCGTGGGRENWYKTGGWSYHEGDESDERMSETAASRGVQLTSRSRPLRPQDMSDFDYILGMDFKNLSDIQIAADYWQDHTKSVPRDYRNKVKLMCSYMPPDSKFKGTLEVPDPWFDDDQERRGFHRVLDLLDDACEGLLASIQSAKQQAQS